MNIRVRHLLISTLLATLVIASGIHVYRGQPGSLERIAAALCYPVLTVGEYASRPIIYARDTVRMLRTYEETVHTLETRCESLQAEVTQLRARALHALHTAPLRAYHERYEPAQHLLARVISRSLDRAQHVLVINRGSNHGVVPGAVVVYCNQLVGIVTIATPWSATVQLITSKKSAIAATSEQGNEGVAQGSGTPQALIFKFVSTLKPLTRGEYVFSSGVSTIVPEGFALGSITHIENDGVCYEATVTPTIDLGTLRYCLVLDRSKIDLY